MATSREERMQQRMRGAQRHQVQDLSFGPLFPSDEAAEEAEAAATPRTNPNSSAKRRPLDDDTAAAASPTQQLQTAAPFQPRTNEKRSPYDISISEDGRTADTARSPAATRSNRPKPTPTRPSPRFSARHAIGSQLVEEIGESPVDAPGSGQRRTVEISSAANKSALLQQAVAAADPGDDDDDLMHTSSPLIRKSRKSEAPPASATSAVRSSTRRSTRLSADAEGPDELSPLPDVVATHSPTQLPPSSASVARRTSSSKSHSSGPTATRRSPRTRLDDIDELSPPILEVAATPVQSSSPLVRRSRRSGDAPVTQSSSVPRTTKRSTRLSAESQEADELSPELPARTKQRGRPSKKRRDEPEEISRAEEDEEEVDELSPAQPSQTIQAAKKRGRPPRSQPGDDDAEEGPQVEEDAEEAEEVDGNEAARRLGRKRPAPVVRELSPELDSQSNSAERPVKRRKKQTQGSPATQKQPRKRTSKGKERAKKTAHDENSDGKAIPITVQRFRRKLQISGDDPDADILTLDIPYASRRGVNTVDVLSQACEEMIELSLEALRQGVRDADDAPGKKELRVKIRAIEAFREELRTRLLEHTIALDTLQTLQKRVRHAQKERLSLRNEIIRVRKEREQVALRMDAVRIKHEAESKVALDHIHLSSAMHDIDLAVERGQAAPELTPTEQKKADLANLELLISRVADQACSTGDGGGLLGQIKSFNAFLERTAAVLEGR